MKPIDHDLAHALADAACEAGDYPLALELLESGERNGRTGVLSSIRTANRILNLRERIGAGHCGRCGRVINDTAEACTGCPQLCATCQEPLSPDGTCPICDY